MFRSFNPLSAVVGALLAAVVFLTMSQTGSGSGLQAPGPARIEYLPHPREIFRIEEGTQFTVPTGKVFVLLSIGRRPLGTGQWGGEQFRCNATNEWVPANGPGSCSAAPPGLTYPGGSVLDVVDSYGAPNDVYATGYVVLQ